MIVLLSFVCTDDTACCCCRNDADDVDESFVVKLFLYSDRYDTANCMALITKDMPKAMATMARWADGPVIPREDMIRFDVTFKADWDVVDTMAARKPIHSNVGVFHEAAPIPIAMGTKDSKAPMVGSALDPSYSMVNTTVIKGMAHLEV